MGPTAELLNALKGRLASVEVVDADGKVTGRSFAEVLSWEYPSDTPTTTLPAVVEKKKLYFSVAYRTETTEETRKLTYEDELSASRVRCEDTTNKRGRRLSEGLVKLGILSPKSTHNRQNQLVSVFDTEQGRALASWKSNDDDDDGGEEEEEEEEEEDSEDGQKASDEDNNISISAVVKSVSEHHTTMQLMKETSEEGEVASEHVIDELQRMQIAYENAKNEDRLEDAIRIRYQFLCFHLSAYMCMCIFCSPFLFLFRFFLRVS